MSEEQADDLSTIASLLAEYDEATAAGQAFSREVPPAHRDRFQELAGCIQLLGRHWPRDAEDDRLTAHRLGRFQVIRELGRGGCGIVYEAHDPLLGRRVALKVPRLEAVLNPEMSRRFLREAQATASLVHPHIVPVFEAGVADSVCYIVSELCPGVTLGEWVRSRAEPVPLDIAARLVGTLARAAHYAHGQNILHRDLTPSNVLLEPASGPSVDGLDAAPRLTDFGMAKLMERPDDQTKSGVLLGTPPYMAPEQVDPCIAEQGPCTDVYALGVILYELLTGRVPFLGPTSLDTLDQVRTRDPLPPSRERRGLPRDLEIICMKCLEKSPSRRYPSAEELALDLDRYLNHQPIQARAAGWWDRILLWSRRPQRVRDAGIVVIAVSGTRAIWLIAGMTLLGTGYLRSPAPLATFRDLGLLLLCFDLPLIWLGRQTLADRIWALWIACGYATANFALMTSTLPGLVRDPKSVNLHEVFGGLYNAQDHGLALAANLLITALAGMQSIASVIGLIAYYANRRKPAAS